MTDRDSNSVDASTSDAQTDAASPPAKQGNPVRLWTFILLGLAIALTFVYLRADRITPYTSQARVHALVIPIAPEVSGTITEVGVGNNQQVQAGEMLFQIDTERYQLAVQNAEANLQAARQSIGASTAGVDAARAQLEIAEANEVRARQDAERLTRIREEDPGAISQRRIEVAEASLASAQASVAAAEANVQRALEDLGDSGDDNTRIQQATAALEQARIDMERASVRAPEDGLVTGVRLDRGNFAGAGRPQMTFIAIDNIWVQADFTENNLGNVRAGNRVDLVFDALPGQVIQGTVRETGFGVAVDSATLGSLPTIRNSREWLRSAQRFPVLIDFDISDPQLRRTLRVGSQVSAVIYTGDYGLFNWLAGLYVSFISVLTYAF